MPEGESTWYALETQCTEERLACEKRHGISPKGNVVTEECWFRPISDEQEFFGPCPRTLRNSELIDIDSVEWTLAKIMLTQYFRANDRITFYNTAKSASDLERILEADPDHYRAIQISLRYAHQLNITANRRLELAMRIPQPDPVCREALWFYIGSLGTLVDFIATEAEASQGISLQELVKSDEMLRDAIELVESTYLKSHESLPPYEKTPIAWSFVSEPFFGRVLRRLGDETLRKHRQFVKEDLRTEFGLGSRRDRTMSLNMLCNDYAFELGLMTSCLELVTHHWKLDVAMSDKPYDDVIEAVTRLVLASSRTCDEPYYLELPQEHFRVVVESAHCVPELHIEVNAEINRLLDQFEHLKNHPELLVLRAYTDLTDESQHLFKSVVADDSKQVVHAILIAKRLNKMGAPKGAELVLEAALEASKNDGEEDFFRCWFPRTDRFWSRSFDGISNHLSMQGRGRVSDARELIETALAVQIDQGKLPSHEGAYVSDPPTSWSNTNYCDMIGNSAGVTP